MYRPGGDAPHRFRPGGILSVGPPPPPPPRQAPAGMMTMVPPHFISAPLSGSGGFAIPQFSGGFGRYPPPPPMPVPPPPLQFPSIPPSYFVPPLPESPPAEVPPPPPPSPPTSVVVEPTSRRVEPLPIEMLRLDLPAIQSDRVEPSVAKLLPMEPPKPHDPEILKNIERLASDVVKNGPRFESIVRAKQAGDPKYAFLFEYDEGPEVSIAHAFYKWKKQTLEAQLQSEADNKVSKHMDQENDFRRIQQPKYMLQQPEDERESEAMSDMDMEDDVSMLFPKAEMNKVSAKDTARVITGLSPKARLITEESDAVCEDNVMNLGLLDSPMVSKGFSASANDDGITEHPGVAHVLNLVKLAECKLTGDYTGAIIENYYSDTSDASGDSEPFGVSSKSKNKLDLKQEKEDLAERHTDSSDLPAIEVSSAVHEHPQTKTSLNESSLARPPKKKLLCLHDLSQNAGGELEREDGSPIHKAGSTDTSDSKGPERLWDTENCTHIFVNGKDMEVATLDERRKPVQEEMMCSSSGEDQQPMTRKRKSRSVSRSRSHSRSRSRSPSMVDSKLTRKQIQSCSGSPELQRDCSTTPMEDSNVGVHGKSEKERKNEQRVPERGKGGIGSNVCVNYARGRCFRGNSCRFLHQDKSTHMQHLGVRDEEIHAGRSKSEVVAGTLEVKAVEKLPDSVITKPEIVAEENGASVEIKEAADLTQDGSGEKLPEVETASKETRSVEGREKAKASRVKKVEVKGMDEWSLPEEDDLIAAPSNLTQQSEIVRPLSQKDASSSALLPTPLSAVSPSPPLSLTASLYQAGSFPDNRPTPVLTSLPAAGAYMQPSFSRPPPLDAGINFLNRSLGPPQGLHREAPFPGVSIHDIPPSSSQPHVSSMQPLFGHSFPPQAGFTQNPLQGFSPQNQLPKFSAYQPLPQQQGPPPTPTSYLSFSPQGSGSNAFVPTQTPYSGYLRPFAGDMSRQFTFSSSTISGLQESAYSKLPSAWPVSRSYESSLVPSSGQPSSYSYNLTSIPPLPSMIKLPIRTDLSTSGDQYDPLSDSLDSGPVLPSAYLKAAEPAGGLTSRLGLGNDKANASNSKPDGLEAEVPNLNETLGDPVVGIVENVSPPDDDRAWSPPLAGEEEEAQEDEAKLKSRKNSSGRGLKLLRSAVAEHVKEVLKPRWKEGHMRKEAFKTIVKKAVDKVTSNLPSHHIPKSQEKVDQFMASSRSKISKLVQGYIDKYLKA